MTTESARALVFDMETPNVIGKNTTHFLFNMAMYFVTSRFPVKTIGRCTSTNCGGHTQKYKTGNQNIQKKTLNIHWQ